MNKMKDPSPRAILAIEDPDELVSTMEGLLRVPTAAGFYTKMMEKIAGYSRSERERIMHVLHRTQ